jgi:hypothetical protein
METRRSSMRKIWGQELTPRSKVDSQARYPGYALNGTSGNRKKDQDQDKIKWSV